jgi:hypothetical protein
MSAENAFRTSICAEYEALLQACKTAFDAFESRVEKLFHAGVERWQIAQQTAALQAEYHAAYDKLLEHYQDCKICQFAADLARNSPLNEHRNREGENQ